MAKAETNRSKAAGGQPETKTLKAGRRGSRAAAVGPAVSAETVVAAPVDAPTQEQPSVETASTSAPLSDEVRAARRRKKEVIGRIDLLTSELTSLKAELVQLRGKLADKDTPPPERRQARARRKEVLSRPKEIASEIKALRQEKQSLRGPTQPQPE